MRVWVFGHTFFLKFDFEVGKWIVLDHIIALQSLANLGVVFTSDDLDAFDRVTNPHKLGQVTEVAQEVSVSFLSKQIRRWSSLEKPCDLVQNESWNVVGSFEFGLVFDLFVE